MEKSELKLAFDYLDKANRRFHEALSADVNKDPLYLDASIQRFEFSFEMCWKTLKRFLEHEGVRAKSAREVFQEAFRLGWLKEGDKFWYQMLEDRNLTSHTYDQKVAASLYPRLKNYQAAYQAILLLLQEKMEALGAVLG